MKERNHEGHIEVKCIKKEYANCPLVIAYFHGSIFEKRSLETLDVNLLPYPRRRDFEFFYT